MACASHIHVAGQTSNGRLLQPANRLTGTYLVMVLVRQRAFPACDAEAQTAPLARHFDLQLKGACNQRRKKKPGN